MHDPLQIRESLTGLPLQNDWILGIDLGIASCGWALIDLKNNTILKAGVWCFETPEHPKTKESNATARRTNRSQRRRLRRRCQRMTEIRKLLFDKSLLKSTNRQSNVKGVPQYDPWQLRKAALCDLLTAEQFAVALIHIAKHRGFQSNSKSDAGSNAPAEGKKMLGGIARMKELSARYKTVGEMIAVDEAFKERKRNRDGEYHNTISRDLLREEVKELFKAQRDKGLSLATDDLEKAYTDLAFSQRPLQDSEKLLGTCPFEPHEKRASRYAYSFELFRLISKLNTIRIHDGSDTGRRLTPVELRATADGFGKGSASLSFKSLRTLIGLRPQTTFVGIDGEREKRDVTGAKNGAAKGSSILYKALGEAAWNSLLHQSPRLLDEIAHILTFREDVVRIKSGLDDLNLEPSITNTLMTAVESGTFASFSGAGHISTLACRHMIPHLLDAEVYSDAASLANYDHALQQEVRFEDITSPVVRRALREAVKQITTLIHESGARPGKIHIEMGREMGKGPQERSKLTKGLAKREMEKQKNKEKFCELLGRDNCSDEELLRYELWSEQAHESVYSGSYINVEDLADNRHVVQVDHIVPRSRSQDNTYTNKVLCLTKENQNKGKKTPWEWKGQDDPEWWTALEARVKALRESKALKGFKARNLLTKASTFEGFIQRNLQDTQYSTRALLGILKNLYTDADGKARHLYARPGALTSMLRHTWGLRHLKKQNGKRVEDDRHHALDAIILAVTTEGTLQEATKFYQWAEENGISQRNPQIDPPWPTFRNDVIDCVHSIVVGRSENRRIRGSGHEATIRSYRMEEDARIVYTRAKIDDLTKAALDRLKDPERNKDVYDALSVWIEKGKPKEDLPKRNNGHLIRKITLRAEKNPRTERAGFILSKNGGVVDNAEMKRVDVFMKDSKYYLVPIYAHQLADRQKFPEPPNLAIAPLKPEKDWIPIDQTYAFQFSLYPYSFIKLLTSKGDEVEGYYRTCDRSTNAITLSRPHSRSDEVRGIGARTLKHFEKLQIDRLGGLHPIKQEIRTWHGVVCT